MPRNIYLGLDGVFVDFFSAAFFSPRGTAEARGPSRRKVRLSSFRAVCKKAPTACSGGFESEISAWALRPSGTQQLLWP